ncbi:MAG: Crp/Fnr family transcriptional regulator, partial [Anaerolineaceae bacterium]|nr:Crp/Fnr family transcriptional regulator [Anaerolineaceae bacterium]
GQIIFVQDEPSAGMFVLIEGKVNLCKLGPMGQQNILATIHPIIMFNEVAVLDCGKNPVTAIATQESTLWHIDCDTFQSLLKRFPEIGLGLLRIMALRNRRLIQHYEDLSYRNVESRVAKLLLDLSQNGSQTIKRKDHSIEEMASLIASVGPVISRTLNGLKQLSFITVTRNTIILDRPDEIARIAGMDLNLVD